MSGSTSGGRESEKYTRALYTRTMGYSGSVRGWNSSGVAGRKQGEDGVGRGYGEIQAWIHVRGA